MASDINDKKKSGKLINLGKNVLLLFLSLVFSLCIMEVVLRCYNPMGFRIKGDKIILPINKKEFIQKPGQLIVNQKNSLGFRGDEPPADFSHWLTIVAVGGSTTECFDLANEKTWPLVLGKKLKNDFKKLWINNAGLCGHSTFGHSVLIQDFLSKLKPKVVLFLVGINEMGIDDPRQKDISLKFASFRSLERAMASLAIYSEVAAVSLNIYRYYFHKTTLQLTSAQDDLRNLIIEVPEKTKLDIIKRHQDSYVKPYGERLKSLLETTKEKQIEPVLITQPGCFGNDAVDQVSGINLGKIKPFRENYIDGDLAWRLLELYNNVTRKIGAEENVLVIDLAREMPKHLNYYDEFVHYTDAGAEKVAEIIYNHLKPFLARKYSNYLLPSP